MFELAMGFAAVGVVGMVAGAFSLGHAIGHIQGTREVTREVRRWLSTQKGIR